MNAGWIGSIVGAVVLAGWALDVPLLTSAGGAWVTTKPLTAVCLALSGAIVALLSETNQRRTLARMTLTMWLSLLCLLSTWAISGATSDAFWAVFVAEAPAAIESTRPGVPSLMTIASFWAVAGVGWASVWKNRRAVESVGAFLTASALVAIVGGYVFGWPLARYYIDGVSTAYAFPTALGFLCVGVGCLQSERGG